MKYRISRRADRDLDHIWDYIAADDARAADRVDAEIHEAIKLLARMPGMGHRRQDVSDPRYRFWRLFWRLYSYLIAYRMDGNILLVVRVIHGARDLRRLFNGPAR